MIDNMKDKINIPRPIHVAMTDQPRFWSCTHSISTSAYISDAKVAPAKRNNRNWIGIYKMERKDLFLFSFKPIKLTCPRPTSRVFCTRLQFNPGRGVRIAHRVLPQITDPKTNQFYIMHENNRLFFSRWYCLSNCAFDSLLNWHKV